MSVGITWSTYYILLFRFIGELFNKKLLASTVLFDFVKASLDKKSTDESVENAAHVLSVTGRELEKVHTSYVINSGVSGLYAFAYVFVRKLNITNVIRHKFVLWCLDLKFRKLYLHHLT